LARVVDVHRREADGTLRHVAALGPDDRLELPLLTGFSVQVGSLFFPR
jgi:hypothetical protein